MGEPENQDGARPRRQRYRGTHPRRFEERYKELKPERYPEMEAHIRSRGGTPAGGHVPILVDELLASLAPKPGQFVVDCTLGHGGHARALLARLGNAGRLLGLDVDGAELERMHEHFAAEIAAGQVLLRHSSYAGLYGLLATLSPVGADAILADLGVSSMQIDDPKRGFSLKHDGPLDMRMDSRRKQSAADLLQALPAAELARHLRELGDEEDAERIAERIVQERVTTPLTRTHELRALVLRAKGLDPSARPEQAGPGAHPAARTFQALRMLVNDELAALKELLRTAPLCLRPGGRIAFLTFHSGEDRLVKKALERDSARGLYEPLPPWQRPSPEEQGKNPRSRSAKMRWAVRSAQPCVG